MEVTPLTVNPVNVPTLVSDDAVTPEASVVPVNALAGSVQFVSVPDNGVPSAPPWITREEARAVKQTRADPDRLIALLELVEIIGVLESVVPEAVYVPAPVSEFPPATSMIEYQTAVVPELNGDP
jgi:hypothetical protein